MRPSRPGSPPDRTAPAAANVAPVARRLGGDEPGRQAVHRPPAGSPVFTRSGYSGVRHVRRFKGLDAITHERRRRPMSTARKLVVAGAAAAVVAGVGASPAVAATDPDLLRLYSAASYPGAQAAIQNAVSYGDRLDSANKKAHDAWPRQVAAYNKSAREVQSRPRGHTTTGSRVQGLSPEAAVPADAAEGTAKTRPAADELGTVRPHRHRQQGGSVPKKTGRQEDRRRHRDRNRDGIQRATRPSRSVSTTTRRCTAWPCGTSRPRPSRVNLVKTDELNIKVGDKIGVIGTLWGNSAIGGLVVVKTL